MISFDYKRIDECMEIYTYGQGYSLKRDLKMQALQKFGVTPLKRQVAQMKKLAKAKDKDGDSDDEFEFTIEIPSEDCLSWEGYYQI